MRRKFWGLPRFRGTRNVRGIRNVRSIRRSRSSRSLGHGILKIIPTDRVDMSILNSMCSLPLTKFSSWLHWDGLFLSLFFLSDFKNRIRILVMVFVVVILIMIIVSKCHATHHTWCHARNTCNTGATCCTRIQGCGKRNMEWGDI